MDPLLLASILGPQLLGMFAGQQDPMRRRQRDIMAALDPEGIRNEGNRLFQDTLSSPGYNMARTDVIGGAQSGIGSLNRALGQTGLAHSGVGLAAVGAAGASTGMQLGRLTSQAWDTAMQNAQQRAGLRAQALGGMAVPQNYAGNMGAASLNSLLPYLFQLMMKQRGMGGGGWAATQPSPGYFPAPQGF